MPFYLHNTFLMVIKHENMQTDIYNNYSCLIKWTHRQYINYYSNYVFWYECFVISFSYNYTIHV